MRRLTFYNRYLEPVRVGTKTTTIRKTRVVRNLKTGDDIILAFGSWTSPTLLRARCLAVTPLIADQLDDAARRRIARTDGIEPWQLDMILGDPEPKTLITFKVLSTSPLPDDAPLFDRRTKTSP